VKKYGQDDVEVDARSTQRAFDLNRRGYYGAVAAAGTGNPGRDMIRAPQAVWM
jgi:hypothetical protein